FDSAFEGVCSLFDIGAIKTDKEQPFGSKQIQDNIGKLKRKLRKNTTSLYQHLLLKKPVREMKPTLPLSVKNRCKEFVSSFSDYNYSRFSSKFIHNKTWKEFEKEILLVVNNIFSTIEDVWNNLALNSKTARALNEGIYQSTVIVLFIQAALKNLSFRLSSFINTSERESLASANRKGDGQVGRHPDIMFMVKHLDMLFEIIECNDGMYYTQKFLNPEKNQFGIVGIQIAGDTLHLNVLIRDTTNIHKYYNIETVKIPVQKSDETIVIKFVETLLFLRNILITNLSLLYYGSVCISERQKEGSTTIDTE
ncbi:11762_t:CDS:2, partial [Scutellospora calospora]